MHILSQSAVLPGRRGRSSAPLRRRLAALLRLWQHRARSRARLRQLDDRLLRDIGISRETAQSVGSKPFWRA